MKYMQIGRGIYVNLRVIVIICLVCAGNLFKQKC